LEAVVSFKVVSRKMMADNNNEKYIILPEHETTYLADGFRIAKDGAGSYWCLYGN